MKKLILTLAVFSIVACNQSYFKAAMRNERGIYSVNVPDGSNVMTIKVGGDCNGYVNEPCATMKICEPGTTNCQTIGNLLIDTGSFGLRVFKSVLTVNVPSITDGTNPYGTCVSYMDGTIQWGNVAKADITMGSVTASAVPIQVIDAGFGGGPPTACGSASDVENDPAVAGFNGILGVGLFAEDCGIACASQATKYYYSCAGTTCTEAAAPIAAQVTNPVAMLPSGYNNGVILQLPQIPSGGAQEADGVMILGIGTSTNNTLTGATLFHADGNGDIRTRFNGSLKAAFIDSGSNGLYFPGSPLLPECSGDFAGFFCPVSLTSLNAMIYDATLSACANVNFSILSAKTIFDTNFLAFDNLGGEYSDGFDWGLPFFFGKTIGFGIEGKSSTLGTGPYYAF